MTDLERGRLLCVVLVIANVLLAAAGLATGSLLVALLGVFGAASSLVPAWHYHSKIGDPRD